jgi:hypothetical protein
MGLNSAYKNKKNYSYATRFTNFKPLLTLND